MLLCAFQGQLPGKNWGGCWNLPIISFLELTQRSPWEWKLECKSHWRLTSPSWCVMCSCFHYWPNCWKCNPEWEGKPKSVVKNWLIFFYLWQTGTLPSLRQGWKQWCCQNRLLLAVHPASLQTDRKFSQKCWASQLCTRSTPQGPHQLISAPLPWAVIFSKSSFLFLLKPKGFCKQGH